MFGIEDTRVLPPEVDKIFRRVQDSAHYMPDWQMEVRFSLPSFLLIHLPISHPLPIASPLKRHPHLLNPLHLLLPPPLRSSLDRPSSHRHPLRLLLAHRQRRRSGREDPVPRRRQVDRERFGVYELVTERWGCVAPGFVFGSDCPGSFLPSFPLPRARLMEGENR